MADDFPIPIPDRLPIKIDPCPIVEAILEVRFVTSESWATLPGLLFAHIRDRYPEQKDLPLAQLPEEIRNDGWKTSDRYRVSKCATEASAYRAGSVGFWSRGVDLVSASRDSERGIT